MHLSLKRCSLSKPSSCFRKLEFQKARAGGERPTLYTPDGKPYRPDGGGVGGPITNSNSLQQFRDSLEEGNKDPVEGPQVRMNFRPPSQVGLDDLVDMDPENSSQLIRTRAKPWFTLAKLIVAMERTGWSPTKIAEATDVDPRTQNGWKVASSVYFSLEADEKFEKELLPFFASEQSPDILAEVRILPTEQRSSAAAFVARNGFDVMQSRELSRAIKDWRYRADGRSGFSETPGDALAFKLWRDANELKKKEEIMNKIERALQVAETEEAKAKLRAFVETLQEGDKPVEAIPSVPTIDLEQQEISFSLVSMAGVLGEVTSAQVLEAPLPPKAGLFGICVPTSDRKWAVLPRWPLLQRSVQLTSVLVPDGIVVEKALNRDKKNMKAQPPVLLMLERFGVVQEKLEPAELYLVKSDEEEKVHLSLGRNIDQGKHPVALVVAVVKSPAAKVI